MPPTWSSDRSSAPRSGLRWGLLFVAWMLLTLPVQAQEDLQARRASTEDRLQNLKQQIQQDQSRLQETTKAEEATQEKLESLQREIALREELVSTYQQRLDELEQERTTLRNKLRDLQDRLDDLQQEYRKRVVHAYKYNRIPDLALILASRSINQMLVRIRYLQRFAQQRQAQRSDVKQAAAQVRASRKKLKQKQAQTEELLANARLERENLEALKADRQQVISQLRSRRSELEEQIQQKQAQARQIEEQIRQIVAKVERRQEQKPEAQQAEQAALSANLSASFKQNKGELPWPAKGAITEGFGNRVDPVHGTETYHPGILIATNPEEQVRSVFKGTVSGVDFVPGYGTYLVVRHGEYLSVYSNFSTLYVEQGDDVAAGEVIGLAGTDEQPRGAGVFFAVFDRGQSTSVDPTAWLTAR
ncbi:peptidoglycan DD-metalloendopeptidase family protein [Salinibacter sp. 10B]|uniref:murein hydrolase activator EnvC family protein n=1 Tax=Salinibacter sp. 10B TaxID=1923971 RepID=UPI000CF42620|nr:peptidoglycan DD-metalloendopeptidase family protein [Salinibacter sp. 10B]